MGIDNPLISRLGIRLPIIQAPMAGTSSPAMAAAASNSGALGSLGVGSTDAAGARAMIAAVRERTSGPLNVNLFCHRPAIPNKAVETAWIERLTPEFTALGATPPTALTEIYRTFLDDEDMLAMLLEERPSVVSFHFGMPRATWIRALREVGIILLASATNLQDARIVAAGGVHAIVAQGWEAGGHRGVFDTDAPDDRIGTMVLTRLFAQTLDLPIIAAGGMMDGTGIAAALKLGASAAQLGTAFVAAEESLADQGYRATLASDAANHTVMTRAISGRPARGLANRFTAFGATVSNRDIPAYPIAYDLGKALNAAGKAKGEFGFGAQWAGQGAPLSRPMPTAQLIATLAAELEEAMRA